MTMIRDDNPVAIDGYGSEHAKFENFVCWHPDRVARVMDTEALQTPAEVFLATHSPLPMFRGDLTGADTLREYDEGRLLADLLAPTDYAFVAVLGGAGTGKSHLIRWLSTKVVPTAGRRVLLIPRAGTNLHEVLRRILKDMEGERFDEYRRRLGETSTAMSVEEARTRLLDNLAVAVEARGRSGDTTLTDEQDYLSAEIPHLLRDPAFRPFFLRAGGVLDRLAKHVVGGGGIERIEERRVFGAGDLPHRFQGANQASRLAQDIYRNITARDDLRQAAASWLTDHIDEAVTQLMRMSGTDLLRLMLDVRSELARQKIELVILIEDLATLQGIDQQLLEALIIRPRQEGMPELCALRTAVAMTSGYYEGLRKNVHQRFDFRLVMGERDVRGTATQLDVERFTARYLNAARLTTAELSEWYRSGGGPAGTGEPVPSACEECPFRGPCHRTFGAHDGMGLYPFSRVAIANITERVSSQGFNPRTQLKEAYKPILENHAPALRDGRFPPPELASRVGGVRLPPIVAAALPRLDPSEHARRAVLLDLWANAREVRNLDPVLHRAFALDALELGEAPTITTAGADARTVEGGVPVTQPERPSPTGATASAPRSPAEMRLERQLREVEEWSAGGPMSQDLMQDLREVVYAAVVAHIDWNTLHLIPGEFSGQKGFRQRNSVNFARQVLPSARATIELPVPLREEELAEAALALQGLLRLKYHRSWRFEDGGKHYRAYLRQVDGWAGHVVAQVDQITESGTVWDPIPASIELLSVGARVLGRPRSRDPERPDLVDALFADVPERDESDRSGTWQELSRLVRKYQEKTQQVVLSRVACSKGESRQIQVIDAARVLPTLSELRRTSRPAQGIPADLDRSSRFLFEYRQAFDTRLDEAVRDERAHQLARYEQVARQLGAENDLPEIAAAKRRDACSALRRVLESAANASVLAGVQKSTFEEALAEFEGAQFQAWAESIQRLRVEEDPGRLLTELSLVPASTARVSTEIVELADRMLTRTDALVRSEVGDNESEGTEELEQVQKAIEEGLWNIQQDLAILAVAEGG